MDARAQKVEALHTKIQQRRRREILDSWKSQAQQRKAGRLRIHATLLEVQRDAQVRPTFPTCRVTCCIARVSLDGLKADSSKYLSARMFDHRDKHTRMPLFPATASFQNQTRGPLRSFCAGVLRSGVPPPPPPFHFQISHVFTTAEKAASDTTLHKLN